MNGMKLKFLNPIFKEKSNVTIRKGSKWSNELGMINIADYSGNVIGKTEIVQTMTLRFNEIPKFGFDLVHDPKLRSYEKYRGFMYELHGGGNFNDSCVVTLIFFNEVKKINE